MLVLVLLGLVLAPAAQAYYNSSTGRWLSRDPIGEQGGRNLGAPVSNDVIDQVDYLGLQASPKRTGEKCHLCCECARGLAIRHVEAKPYPLNNFPGTFFEVVVLLDYEPSPIGGSASFKWEESSNRPSKDALERGAKPNQWFDTSAPNPNMTFGGSGDNRWPNRKISCDPPVGREFVQYDWASINPRLPQRTLHFRFTVTNPICCKDRGFSLTAVQTSNGANDPTFTTPDPNSPP